ncbi:MAG TPA: DUF4385 domain-containing protein [Pyrinomonadaceae bacterium]|nr:DUF4385 domain-containing protein [Pyrinomonadaceae bacterium]
MSFDYELDFKQIDFRQRPELYRIGKGEQGVLLVEPYKSEILPHWRFKNPTVARASADKIYELYLSYRTANNFPGMDMARKFLQMGWTRSLRYFNHRSGKKYVGPVPAEHKGRSGAWGREVAPYEHDEEKLESAKIFRTRLDEVLADPIYVERVRRHRELYEPSRREAKVKTKKRRKQKL